MVPRVRYRCGLGSRGPLLSSPNVALRLSLYRTTFQRCVVAPWAIGVGIAVLHVYLGSHVAAMGRSLIVITVHSSW